MIIEAVCLAIMAAAAYLMSDQAHSKNLFQRGFFCNDQSIRYPHLASGMPDSQVFIITGYAVVFVNFGLENTGTWKFWRLVFWVRFYRKNIAFLFGYAATLFTTEFAKFVGCRLRPNFMEVCRPLPYWNISSCAEFHNTYITDFSCSINQHLSVRVQQSFFSGHASLSGYSMVFLTLVLQRRLRGHLYRVLRVLLQACLLTIAFFICVQRANDYWHHPDDVLIGLLFGVAIAILVHSNMKCSTSGKGKQEKPHKIISCVTL